MALPKEPVTLSVPELHELNKKLADMRHDINNHLSLIIAAIEIIRHKPDSAPRILSTLADQPARISNSVRKFTAEFDQAFGITRT